MQSTTLLFWNASTLQLADRRHVTIGHRYRHLVEPHLSPSAMTTAIALVGTGSVGRVIWSAAPYHIEPHLSLSVMTVAIALLGKGVWEESYGAPRRTPPPHGRECGRSRMPPPHVTIRHRSGVWEESGRGLAALPLVAVTELSANQRLGL
ncbi:hypothetical protein J6590_011158 [Homalodisca vitripennis]|nr:hypothetical protein J6590_011158 [Homalodisca vitripennis]